MEKSFFIAISFFVFVGFVFAATSGVNIVVGNTAPNITSVTAPSAQDPNECTTTSIPTIRVNVTDADGYTDINASASYVNVTYSGTTHQTTSCVFDTNATTWVVLNCTSAAFNYYDTATSWTLTAYVKDNASGFDTDSSSSVTFNTGTLMRANNTPITFGTVYAGTNNNVNTNSPNFFLENCGNIALNTSITGANITDGSSNKIVSGQFRIDDDATPSEGGETLKAELTLTEAAQNFSKAGGITVQGVFNIYSFLNVPIAQAKATYNSGTWTFTPSQT